MKKIMQIIISVIALTVLTPGHAEEAKINHWANLRATSDLGSKKIVKIKPNTKVELVEESENFDQIIYRDKLGWVRREFVTKVATVSESAKIDPIDLATQSGPDTSDRYFIKKTDADRIPSMIDSMVSQTRDQLDNFAQAVSHPWITFSFTERDEDCLARNIYYEAGSESEEGKVAVAIVTINRVKDGRFDNTICRVVNQRVTVQHQRTIEKIDMIQTGYFGSPRPVSRQETQIIYVPVCQFSWACAFIRRPTVTNTAWQESQRIAHEILNDGYEQYRMKFGDVLYFHSTGVRPIWAAHKRFAARVGGHLFYQDVNN